MKNLQNFDNFKLVKESQSKKIRKYIDFSTFLEWFNENRPKIAAILDVDVDELVDEDEIMDLSSGLITGIINRQSFGNSGKIGRASCRERV